MGMFGSPSGKDIREIIEDIAGERLVLSPDFQRNYIWTPTTERHFIDSILRGYAVPPVWVWVREGTRGAPSNRLVVDGQQRLTCLQRFRDNKFQYKKDPHAKHQSDICDRCDGKFFRQLSDDDKDVFWNREITFIKVTTSDRDVVIDIFKRLNKGASQINPQEFRNAFFEGPFKESVYSTAKELKDHAMWGRSGRPFEVKGADRMGAEKMLSEIYAALIFGPGQVLDKSDKVDGLYRDCVHSWSGREDIERRFWRSLKILEDINLSYSRYVKLKSAFYTTLLVVDELLEDGYKIGGRSNIGCANLSELSKCLGDLDDAYGDYGEKYRKVKNKPRKLVDLESANQTLASYYRTLNAEIHTKDARRARRQIILDSIKGSLEKIDYDPDRLFSPWQRDLLWARAAVDRSLTKAKCADCEQEFTRDEVHFDHIRPWSDGGRSRLENGQVLCVRCNQIKSDR